MIAFSAKKMICGCALLAVLAFSTAPARGSMMFQASLDASQEVPPNASIGTGFGTVLLNNSETLITVNVSFSDLTTPAILGHIHGPAPIGVNASVLFPFSNVPNATSGILPQQSFAITPQQVAELKAGLFYFNIHTEQFPGGEIRGQIIAANTVPEVGASMLLFALSLAGLLAFAARSRLGPTCT